MANEDHLNKLAKFSFLIKTHENFMLINQLGWKNDERRIYYSDKMQMRNNFPRLETVNFPLQISQKALTLSKKLKIKCETFD